MRITKATTKRLLGVLAALAAVLAIGAGSATAITDGHPDGNGHPYVGLMEAWDSGGNSWFCSGTLLSSTVFLTAGHCVEEATTARVWLDPGPVDPSATPTYGTSSSFVLAPGYAFVYRDLGLVNLTLTGPAASPPYGALPKAGRLDKLKGQRGHQDETFTTVGYGMEKSFPPAAAGKDMADLTRRVATPQLLQIDGGVVGDFGMVLSNNAHTGGVCFGDSGGPNLVDGNIIAGITVALANPTCAGTGTVLRLDREWILDWLGTFGLKPPSS